MPYPADFGPDPEPTWDIDEHEARHGATMDELRQQYLERHAQGIDRFAELRAQFAAMHAKPSRRTTCSLCGLPLEPDEFGICTPCRWEMGGGDS